MSSGNVFGIVLLLDAIIAACSSGNTEVKVTTSICAPAEHQASLKSSSCHPLNNFTNPFCKEHGVILSNYVFRDSANQDVTNKDMNAWVYIYNTYMKRKVLNVATECFQAALLASCFTNFPACDGTKNVFQEKKLCRETCRKVAAICRQTLKKMQNMSAYDFYRKYKDIDAWCLQFPSRNAGESPECQYFNLELFKRKDTSQEFDSETDCLYLNGSSYTGNISVTASGTPCQSWTSQCPHRHTMNTTYPELNNANNFCRNPQNSEELPWCFTMDRKKRWEYCNIPKCIPVDGKYGNWTTASQCSVTCGQGFEEWNRTCTSPSPKYGGKNCNHLGNSTEYRNCSRNPCPVNGGYGNWTLSSTCNASCGQGFEIWRRACDNPVPRYGGSNCNIFGVPKKFEKCTRKPCPDFAPYSVLVFDPRQPLQRQRATPSDSCSRNQVPRRSPPTPNNYENTDEHGEPQPGRCRGIVNHESDYVNTQPSKPWYSKLLLFRPIVIDWLRNAWGNVDMSGRHVYDVLQRPTNVTMPYTKLKIKAKRKEQQPRNESEAVDEFDSAVYDRFERYFDVVPSPETRSSLGNGQIEDNDDKLEE